IRYLIVTGVQTCALPIYTECRVSFCFRLRMLLDKFSDPQRRHRPGLTRHFHAVLEQHHGWDRIDTKTPPALWTIQQDPPIIEFRSEERRVGKECRCWRLA